MTATATALKPPASAAPVKTALPPVLSLDDRILAALRDHAASVVIGNLITEAEDAVTIAERHHPAAKERAIDPTTPSEAVAEARRVMEDRSFIADRMREAARRLKDELGIVRAREAKAARDIEISAFFADRDLLIRDLRLQYENAAGVIVSLIKRLHRSDAEMARLGLGIDVGAETQARGLPPNFYAPGGTPIPRLRDVRLPDFHGHDFLCPR